MPEKTRDRKNWFPRFKSNWLGTYRSKQMFLCCECAVTDVESARYKGAEGKHCLCGRDQWHLAKQIEEAEYNRRMEISKSFGGIRYEEAVERIKNVGGSEFEFDDSRVRCESEESTVSTSSTCSLSSTESNDYRHIKMESMSPASRIGYSHELKLSMGPNVYAYDHQMTSYSALHKASPTYASHHANYTPLPVSAEMSPYDHLAPPPFTDEESFGELLQGILEEDPRSAMQSKMMAARAAPYTPYAQMKRYPVHENSMPMPVTSGAMDFDLYHASHSMPTHHHNHHQHQQHPNHHHQQPNHDGYSGYYPQQPHAFGSHQQQPHHMVQPATNASFPSAV